MYKKPALLIILFLFYSVLSYGQEAETVLSAPDNWQSEIIPFPLGFAPGIGFVGFEDLRFAPGWNNPGSQEFWAYTFAWYVEKDSAMTENKLDAYFTMYYDGLMGIDGNNQRDTAQTNQLNKTLCLFVKTDEGFTGKMRVYDRFFTKDYITLNIKVKESFCPETNKQIILFNISPKDFGNEVWGIFDDVKLNVNCN